VSSLGGQPRKFAGTRVFVIVNNGSDHCGQAATGRRWPRRLCSPRSAPVSKPS